MVSLILPLKEKIQIIGFEINLVGCEQHSF